MASTTAVGVRAVRADLAAMVRRAQRGETIIITIDGHPSAALGPLDNAPTPDIDQLVARGLASAPRRRGSRSTLGQPSSHPNVEPLPIDARIDTSLDELRG